MTETEKSLHVTGFIPITFAAKLKEEEDLHSEEEEEEEEEDMDIQEEEDIEIKEEGTKTSPESTGSPSAKD